MDFLIDCFVNNGVFVASACRQCWSIGSLTAFAKRVLKSNPNSNLVHFYLKDPQQEII
jgi:hypothetical protein